MRFDYTTPHTIFTLPGAHRYSWGWSQRLLVTHGPTRLLDGDWPLWFTNTTPQACIIWFKLTTSLPLVGQ
jgi:hypothetical protein